MNRPTDHSALLDWILDVSSNMAPQAVIAEFGERVVEAGIQVDRLG